MNPSVSFDELLIGAHFLRRLPGFLRQPICTTSAAASLRERLQRREAGFLALARRFIYANPGSPYRELLRVVGCEYTDLARLVEQEGVEGALRALYQLGVYLTLEEYKGHQPIVRGSATLRAGQRRLRNPGLALDVPRQTGGSRGSPSPVPLSVPNIRERAINTALPLAARGGAGWSKAVWGVPGGSMVTLLQYSLLGSRPRRWFLQVSPSEPGLHARYRWSTRALHWGGRLAGVALPGPEYVPLDHPLPVARWLSAVVGAGGTPHLDTAASSAVRLCQAALESGLELGGAQFTVRSEPVTRSRLAAIRRAGAEAVPRYATTECGPIGYGCLAPEHSDDVHLHHDTHAVIQPPDTAPGLRSDLLLMTSLTSTAPLILLNVSLGDRAVVSPRSCGCPLEELGWTTHLHTIRSFEKLTGEGMTFLDADVVQVLEEVLPGRFGGGPTDYQLVEQESEDGRPLLRLLVHPAVGPLDERQVAESFLSAIGSGSGAEHVMELHWRRAGLLRVERTEPRATVAGKILHVIRSSPSSAGSHDPPGQEDG